MKSLSITTNFELSAAGENYLRRDTRRCLNNRNPRPFSSTGREDIPLYLNLIYRVSRAPASSSFLFRYNIAQRYIMEVMEVHPLSRRWPFLHRSWKMDATVVKQRHFHRANYPVDRR